jgi:hypothetical protein
LGYFWAVAERLGLISVCHTKPWFVGNSAGVVGDSRDSVANKSARGRLDVAVNTFAQTVTQLPDMFCDLVLDANNNSNQLRVALSRERDGRRRMLETLSDL